MNNLTKKSLSLAINPVRQVTVTIDPDIFRQITGTSFWETFRRGRAYYITVDTLFHPVNAAYRLSNWTASDSEDTGNFEVVMTMDRIYPQVADFGNSDL